MVAGFALPRRPALPGGIFWLLLIALAQIAVRSVGAITVRSGVGDPPLPNATPTPPDDRNGSDNGTVAYRSSGQLACSAMLSADRSRLLLERSENSLRLYLLHTTSGILQRIEHAPTRQAIDRTKVCALPAMEDEPRSLQVLDVHLGGTAYVLFVVSSSEWHYVYLARSPSANDGQQDSNSEMAQTIQRLKRNGETVRVRLLECSGQLYLVTIHTFGNMGKIRIYRWLQSYFSLVGTREVSSLDDIQCHCPGPLLLLALDYAPLPERSMNHVLLLDGASTAPVKVQGMYFLSTTLPSFMLGGELFLVRQVSKDKSYLYQWSSEGRFIRQRMVPFQAADVSAVASWDATVAIAIGDAIRLYTANRHNLLRVESPFTVRSNGTASSPLTQLPIGPEVAAQQGPLSRLYALRAGESDEGIALVLEYRCSPDITANGTALRVYRLTVESDMTARTEASQEHGFHALSGCLQRLKERLNERKQWIDLVRLQLSKRQSAFEALHQTGPGNTVLLQPTAHLQRLVLPHDNPHLLPPSRTVLNGQTLLLRHYRVATDLNQVLLLNRPRADIEGDLHVGGNIRASSSNIREVHGLDAGARSRRTAWSHYGAGPQPVHSSSSSAAPHRIIVAREVIADSTVHKRFWSKSKTTVLPGTVQLDVLSAGSVRLPSQRAHINQIAVPSERALDEASARGYGGHKVLPSVHTARLMANSVNGAPLPMQLLANGLQYASDGATIQSDRAHVRNLLVRDTVNGFSLNRFVPVHQPAIQGNLVLSEEVCVRYLIVHRTIGDIDQSALLDRVSPQTLTGPVFVSKGFTHSLTVRTLNDEPASNYAVLPVPPPSGGPSSAHLVVQPTVRTAKLTILSALIVDHERQQFGPHIGTLRSDFRQLYPRKVVINGALRLHGATTITGPSPNITLNAGDGQQVVVISSPEAYQIGHYLLRNRRQIVEHQVTYRMAQLQYLFANTLNEVGLWQLCLTHFNWQNSLYLHEATVRGQVRAARIAPRLHTIKRSRVALHSTISLCNTAKHFQGRLSVAHLQTGVFASAHLPVAALWLKAGQQYEAAPITVGAEVELHETTVQLLLEAGPGTGLHALTTLPAGYPADTLYRGNAGAISRLQPDQQLRLAVLEADLLTVQRVEQAVAGLGALVKRFVATPGPPNKRHWMASSFAKIVLDAAAAPQHIPSLTVRDINVCPIGRLLGETVRKHDTSGGHRRPIEGWKRVQGSLTVAEELRVVQLNQHPAHLLGQVVTRGHTASSSPSPSSPVPQMIESRWQFGAVRTPYFTAKTVNRMPLTLVALRMDAALPLHGDLFVERFHLRALEWPHAATEGVRLDDDPPVRYPIAAINRCRCYGTVIEPRQHGGGAATGVPGAPHELLLFAPLPGMSPGHPIAGVVIFNTTEVHFGRVTQPPQGNERSSPIERIAELCLRRNHSSIVFHREQLLHATATVRQSLRIGSGAPLSVGRIAGVPIAERLAPGGGVFLLGSGRPALLPITGRKRFTGTGVATVRNLTLLTDESRLLGVLLPLTGPSPHTVPPLVVQLGAGATVERQLTATHLNYTPLEWFFHAFFRRVPPPEALGPKGSLAPALLPPRYMQDFRGTLTVTNLQLRGTDTILHHINGIPLADVVTRTTDNAAHQIVTAPKVFRGAVRLGGPLSLHHYNGIAVASIKQKIVSPGGPTRNSQPAAAQGATPEVIIFNRPVRLDALWSKHTYESRTASTVLSMDGGDADQRSQAASMESLLAANLRQQQPTAFGRVAMNRRRSSIDTSFVRTVALARTVAAAGGVRYECAPDRRTIAVRDDGPSATVGSFAVEPTGHHCRAVLGVAAINSTTNLLLVLQSPSTNGKDSADTVLYTADRRLRQGVRPLEMPNGIGKRSVRGAALLVPDREDIMLALLVTPDAPAPATVSPTVRIFRLENRHPLTAGMLRFAPFQTISSSSSGAAHVSALLTSADQRVLVLQEHTDGSQQQQQQQQQHLYEYNSVAGWTESTDHLV